MCEPRLQSDTSSSCGTFTEFDECKTDSFEQGFNCIWNENPNDVDEYFPMPFFILVTGYVIMLIIDKVLFDTHVILGDHHGEGDSRPSVL